MILRRLKNTADFQKGFAILAQLRTHLDFEAFKSVFEAAHLANDYRMIGAFDDEHCLGVLGCRVVHDFANGKQLYIDDLVVDAPWRRKGIGSDLLRYAENLALEMGCGKLRLCSGNDNLIARDFYQKHGWKTGSMAFKKSAPDSAWGPRKGNEFL